MQRLYSFIFCLLLLACIGSGELRAQFPAQCDQDKSCIGNALTTTVTSGKEAQYVDIDTSYRLRRLDYAITFEAWIKPQDQSGKRQFVGGLWGPNKDDNDQWVVFIEGTRISFVLSADGSRLEDADNTAAVADVPDLYTRGWTHLAVTWDSGSTAARIYIDGVQQASATNTNYPVRKLHPVSNRNLLMQLGSCSGLYDDANRYRTFLGQMEEVRLWSRALTQVEIRCQKDKSLNGNEPDLVLYYRCNEGSSTQTLCDATGHGIAGRMRSGAHCERSDRPFVIPYTVTPTSVNAPLKCTSDTTLPFTLTDTSYCGATVTLQVVGRDAKLFTVSSNSLVLTQNTPVNFTVRMVATIVGTISAELQITNTNRCGSPLKIPLTFNRKTELDYSEGQIEVDTLYVGCVERPYEEKPLTITNTTGRTMRINSIGLADTTFHWLPQNPGRPLPTSLAPGETWTLLVRKYAADTTKTEYDTLRVFSDDLCPGSGVIPLTANTQDVLILLDGGGNKIDSMKFEDVCPNQISNVQVYQYRSGVGEVITIDSIQIDDGFFGRRFRFPITLQPLMAYQATFVRFKPTRPGPYTGQLRARTTYRGCTIVKTIHLTGRGINVDFGYDAAVVGLGNVTIGKTKQQSVNVVNRGERLRASAYLKVGDVFRIAGGRSFNLATGQTAPITLEFRPREPITYYDTLCIFDEQCFSTQCIPISGTGVFDALSFVPPYLSLSNVVGCNCKIDSITIKNVTSSPAIVTSATLNDGTGKFTLLSGPSSGTMAPDEIYQYVIRYCPNDLADDRTDQAYIDVNLSDGQKYQVLIRGTSTVPKIFVTPLTTYGVVEVGWTKTEKVLVENISTIPLQIDAVNAPAGYTVVATSKPLPVMLGPRDSLIVDVMFSPVAEVLYDGMLNVVSTSPCPTFQNGRLTGTGVIYRLDVPLSFVNYGFVRPCDCSLREIPLPNNSAFKQINIDSIWIDGRNVTSPRPNVFRWTSKQTGGSTLPYVIAPQTVDTLVISFCPNIPAIPQNLLANAKLHIKAHTVDWSREDTVTMSGRRELNFQPNRSLVQFPNTRAGTTSAPIVVELTVPDEFVNPSGDSIIVTNITFNPDAGVFTARAVTGVPLPWVIRRGEKFQIAVRFTPRAPRPYVARMNIHTSYPCQGVDTTVLVRGEGFAFPFGMHIAFDTNNSSTLDTFRMSICDTLLLPVMADRDMPQDRIDIHMRITYDSTILKLTGATSDYTTNVSVIDTGGGAWLNLKDARNVVADTIALIRFVPRSGDTIIKIYIGDVDFDSDSLVLYKIVVPPDSVYIDIAQPRIAVTSVTNFDTVNLKSCADRIVVANNPGRVPIRFDSLSLPLGHRIVASSLPYPTMLAPGDSIFLTVRFCPYIEQLYDTTISAVSNLPCPITATGMIHSFGYAPPFPMRLALDANIGTTDTLRGTIADTIEMPIIVDRDIPQTPLDVHFTLAYNRHALQFLSLKSAYGSNVSATENSGGIRVSLPHCDSIRQGEIARARFVFTVPDSVISRMRLVVASTDFTSDSVFWVKLIPTGDTSGVHVDPQCNITRLNFRGGANKLSAPTPNPSRGTVNIQAEFFEDARARLTLYNSAGQEVARLLDGTDLLQGGRYNLEFDTSQLPAGAYFYVLDTGRFSATEKLRVLK